MDPPRPPLHYGAAGAMPHNAAAAAAGPSHVPPGPPTTLPHTGAAAAARAAADAVAATVAARQRARAVPVPTDDAVVRKLLRRLASPVTLFGEREPERRARLRAALAAMDPDAAAALVAADSVDVALGGGAVAMDADGTAAAPPAVRTERFFTEGPPALAAARTELAVFSLKRASARLAAERADRASGAAAARDAAADALSSAAALLTSEVGDGRPLAAAAFSSDGAALATGGWSGAVRLWSVPECTAGALLRGHTDRVTGVAWRPGAPSCAEAASEADASTSAALATGGVDRTLRLWSAGGRLVSTLTGHTDRLARVAWHPAGAHAASASFDGTWRLWDAAAGVCLVEQEGHGGGVYAAAFHPDGSLAITGGLDGHALLWDVRTGRIALALSGHAGAVLGVAASLNGVTVATASDDATARLWDLRAKDALAVLPGHTGLVSSVTFCGPGGGAVATAGFDGGVRLWRARDGALARALDGGGGRLADVAACPAPPGGAGLLLATAGHDRTVKLWGGVVG